MFIIDKVILLDKAMTLSEVYGNKLDTAVYTQGVGISGVRIRPSFLAKD